MRFSRCRFAGGYSVDIAISHLLFVVAHCVMLLKVIVQFTLMEVSAIACSVNALRCFFLDLKRLSRIWVGFSSVRKVYSSFW